MMRRQTTDRVPHFIVAALKRENEFRCRQASIETVKLCERLQVGARIT
jgi:hypothetical protein